MYQTEYRLLFGITLCFSLFIIVLSPDFNFYWDQLYWLEWSKTILQNGLGSVYDNKGVNYSPLFLYVLKLFARINGTPEKIDANIRLLRLFVLAFDAGGTLLAGRMLQKSSINPLYSLFILFNPAYLYNTLIWGQVDTVHTFLAAASIFFAVQRKPVFSVCMFLLAYNTKLQAIIFLPVSAIILLPQFIKEKRKLVFAIIGLVITEILVFLPFIIHGHFHDAFSIGSRQMDYYPVVSMNADNLWRLIFNQVDVMKLSDQIKFAGITYKLWGIIMFLLTSFFALLPLCLYFLLSKNEDDSFPLRRQYSLAFLVSTLIALDFFYFNTQMHERYSHPVILLAGIYCLLEGNFILYILLSFAYILNLDRVMRHLHFPDHVLIMSPFFIAILFGLSILLGYFELYKKFGIKYKWPLLKAYIAK